MLICCNSHVATRPWPYEKRLLFGFYILRRQWHLIEPQLRDERNLLWFAVSRSARTYIYFCLCCCCYVANFLAYTSFYSASVFIVTILMLNIIHSSFPIGFCLHCHYPDYQHTPSSFPIEFCLYCHYPDDQHHPFILLIGFYPRCHYSHAQHHINIFSN